jgi:hypothetical protein
MLDKKARLTAIEKSGCAPWKCLLLATKAHSYKASIAGYFYQKSSGSMKPGNHLVERILIISG